MPTSDMLLRRYRLIKPIGSGTFATVYLAQDNTSNEYYAVKIIDKKWFANESMYERFSREVELGMQLRHDHIAKVHSYGKTQQGYYIVMEWVEGVTLRQYMQKRTKIGMEEAIRIIRQVLSALNYAYHQGVTLHRDLKPENIMIEQKTGRVVVLDFGIAQIQGSTITRHTRVFSLRYAAPEQLAESKQAFYRSTDLYSIAVILYEMLTRRTPFRGRTVVELYQQAMKRCFVSPHLIRPELSPGWDSFFEMALHPNPKERFQDPSQMAEGLLTIKDQKRTPTASTRDKRQRKSSGAGAVVAVLLVIFIIGAMGAFAWLNKDAITTFIEDTIGKVVLPKDPNPDCFLKIVSNTKIKIKILSPDHPEFSKFFDMRGIAPSTKVLYLDHYATNWGNTGNTREIPKKGTYVFECEAYLMQDQTKAFYFILSYDGSDWIITEHKNEVYIILKNAPTKGACAELWINVSE